MKDVLPVPWGALRAVFRDMDAEDGLKVLPVVGFAAPASPGGAMVFGGPFPQTFPGPPASANPGAEGVPVVLTRRGELRAVRTALPAPTDANDAQDAARADIGLTPGEVPGPVYLGVVRSNEDPTQVFAKHVTAAREHAEAIEAAKSPAPAVSEPLRTVDAQVSDAEDAKPRTAKPRTGADVAELLAAAKRMTASQPEDDGDE